MAPTRHQETGPAAGFVSHAALSHSSGCDRDGGGGDGERGRGRPLKRQQLQRRGLLGTRARGGTGSSLGGSEPPFPVSTLKMSGVSFCQCL